jgi:hypothetical protein
MCQTRQLPLTAQLLSRGASPLNCNLAGANSLLLAAYHANIPLLSLLLSHPAARSFTEQHMRTAYLLAARGWIPEHEDVEVGDVEGRGREREMRRRVQAMIAVGWTRLIGEVVYDVVECFPRELAELVAEMAVGFEWDEG